MFNLSPSPTNQNNQKMGKQISRITVFNHFPAYITSTHFIVKVLSWFKCPLVLHQVWLLNHSTFDFYGGCILGQPLADKTTGVNTIQARHVIPVTSVSMAPSSSPHVAAWLGSVSIRFIVVPVGVFWTRLVSPDKLAYQRVPLQSDPNLSRPWGVFINQVQNKLVFFIAVDLHKIPPFAFAVRSSLLPTFDCATHKVTVAFEMRPATGAGIFSATETKKLVITCYFKKAKSFIIWTYKDNLDTGKWQLWVSYLPITVNPLIYPPLK